MVNHIEETSKQKHLKTMIEQQQVVNAEMYIERGLTVATCECGNNTFYKAVSGKQFYCAECGAGFEEGGYEPEWESISKPIDYMGRFTKNNG